MILVDANIFMYAAGRESPQQQPCRRFLERVVSGEGPDACTDCEVLQEILHRYRTLGEEDVAADRPRVSPTCCGLTQPSIPGEQRGRWCPTSGWVGPGCAIRDEIGL
jgi:hypothetical protein